MKNVFTIDTEEWFHANYEDNLFSNSAPNISLIEPEVDVLLQLFEKYNVRATFFVLGTVAEAHPAVIKKIASCGHEIASHGYGHQLAYRQTPEEFRAYVLKSKQILEAVIGKAVCGYRAPSWSITEESLWALDILEDLGFIYTSSIFPTKNFLYGIPYAPRFRHDCKIYGKERLDIINIPPSTAKVCGKNVPFSGGAYFRLMPTGVINLFTRQINKGEEQPVIFYLHPREIDPKQPRLKLKFMDRIIHYYGIHGCRNKLEKILNKNEFMTMKDFCSQQKTN